MTNKLTPKHLEVLLRLGNSKELVKYTKFLPDLNPVLDLIEKHYVNKRGEFYELSSKGREYFNKIFPENFRIL